MSKSAGDVRYGRIVPVIHVTDIERGHDFYSRIFGFEKVFENGDPVGFMILEKDEARLALARYKDHKARTENVAVLLVDDVDALYAICERNAVRIIKRLRDHEYGLRAFVFEDPEGNRIDVGQRIGSPAMRQDDQPRPEAAMTSPRDFSTISPSARALLIMKAQTDIPFAHEAAYMLCGADEVSRELERLAAIRGGELRLRHFEDRYRSIDTLLAGAGATRILELAGGLSFRGLALARREPVFYLDTDLPEMAATKAQLVAALHDGPLVGTLRVAALDALDGEATASAVAELPAGPIAVVNEGLLVYLDEEEKARLAGHLRAALLARGGSWITADIYVRSPPDPRVGDDERLRTFLDQHRVEENKFESWEAAERFFAGCGLSVAHRLSPGGDVRRIRESWVLTAR